MHIHSFCISVQCIVRFVFGLGTHTHILTHTFWLRHPPLRGSVYLRSRPEYTEHVCHMPYNNIIYCVSIRFVRWYWRLAPQSTKILYYFVQTVRTHVSDSSTFKILQIVCAVSMYLHDYFRYLVQLAVVLD